MLDEIRGQIIYRQKCRQEGKTIDMEEMRLAGEKYALERPRVMMSDLVKDQRKGKGR